MTTVLSDYLSDRLPDYPSRSSVLALVLFCQPALGFATEADMTASADAVSSAMAVTPPDYSAVISDAAKDPSEILGAVGSASTDGLDKQTSLYQNGMGVLYDPAVETVVNCRTETDTTCRAIQILDKGFPERPPVPDDMLLGRDETVGNASAGDTGIENGTTGCRPVTVTTGGTETTETCRPGGWFTDVSCRTGVTEIGIVTAKYFSCGNSEARREDLSCRSSVAPGSVTSWNERCFFGTDASNDYPSLFEKTEATATALFPANCTAPQGSVETVSCQEILTVTSTPGCTAGTVTSASAKGGLDLFSDACALGDTLTISHTCGVNRIVTASLNGFPSVSLREGYRVYMDHNTDSRCHVNYSAKRFSCTTESCVAQVTATVTLVQINTGSVTVILTYPNQVASQEEVWEDRCAGIRDEVAQ